MECNGVYISNSSHLCNDDDDTVVVTSVVGDGRGPGWDPVGVPG